jgi:uncharacterized membrane protein YraQ (UPF0718 family)
MTDLGLQLDMLTAFSFAMFVFNKGLFRYLFGLLFFILLGIKILEWLDITKSKTMDLEELKKEMPDIYYKLYATEEEKTQRKIIEGNHEIQKMIKKSMKSDLRMWMEENPDKTANIISWIIIGIIMVIIILGILYFIDMPFLLENSSLYLLMGIMMIFFFMITRIVK